ncbi:hypothetical protein FQN57_003759 [Myotisia sp. PD_48]|nr:hypothetical protein FQN57_003759 [Myotisia sp. PD_48]
MKDPPIPWPEIFYQHEYNLNSQLEICSKLGEQLSADASSFQALSSIIHQTQQLMNDAKKLKNEFLPRKRGGSGMNGPEKNGSFIVHEGKKRRHNADDDPMPGSSTLVTKSKLKRARVDGPINTPATATVHETEPEGEVEDISEEVERRLRLREEYRRKRRDKPQTKRKRESLDSSYEESEGRPNSSSQRRKKLKADNTNSSDARGLEQDDTTVTRSKRKPSDEHSLLKMHEDHRRKRTKT